MKTHLHSHKVRSGFTLIELSVVIFILIALLSIGVFFSNAITDWQAGKKASETLRGVYVAQRTYLADNPTTSVDTLTKEQLLPYLPDKASTFPEIEGLDGQMRPIDVTKAPPVIKDGDGVYDPSENPNDSLWDVGE